MHYGSSLYWIEILIILCRIIMCAMLSNDEEINLHSQRVDSFIKCDCKCLHVPLCIAIVQGGKVSWLQN